MHHCFPLVFICPAPPRIHTHTLVSSPAGRRTGGAVLVFIAMKGAECLFMIPVCVLQLFVPITHIEVNDYFKLLEAVVVWRELLKLFRVLCVSSKNLITKLRMRCGERAAREVWASTWTCWVSNVSKESKSLSSGLAQQGDVWMALLLRKWKDSCGKSNLSQAMTQWEKGPLFACDSFTHRIISKTAASES